MNSAEANRMAGRLMIPTNFDPRLLGRLEGFRPAYLYGSLPNEATLRGPLVLPAVLEDTIVDQVESARAKGIGFIYVMNATTSPNAELSEEGRYRVLQRCEWLSDIGASGVVLANPFLIELVRHWFPKLEVHVSILAEVDSVNVAKYYDDLGVALIHLAPDVNRRIPTLEAIRKAVGCRLSVLVNEGCVFECPLRSYHASVVSNAKTSIEGGYHTDYCYYSCSMWKGASVVEFIRTPWIRPQDVSKYLDIGIDVVKIAGREKMGDGPSSHSDWIVKATSAYYRGDCDDLAELLVGMEPPDMLDGSALPRDNRVIVHSRSLDGFLQFFADGRCTRSCHTCRYRSHWADIATEVRGDRQKYVDRLAQTRMRLIVGDFRTGRPAH
jgi:collagenase-like PrtC family protease